MMDSGLNFFYFLDQNRLGVFKETSKNIPVNHYENQNSLEDQRIPRIQHINSLNTNNSKVPLSPIESERTVKMDSQSNFSIFNPFSTICYLDNYKKRGNQMNNLNFNNFDLFLNCRSKDGFNFINDKLIKNKLGYFESKNAPSLLQEISTILDFTRANSSKSSFTTLSTNDQCLDRIKKNENLDQKKKLKEGKLLKNKRKRGIVDKINLLESNLSPFNNSESENISQVNYTFDEFQSDLKEVQDEKHHIFMKTHFSIMYSLKFFYKFNKLLKEKRKVRLNSVENSHLTTVSHQLNICKGTEYSSEMYPKKMWSPHSNEQILNNILTSIQTILPNKKLLISEENLLEFLFINKYDSRQVLKMIIHNDPIFLNFVDKKITEIPVPGSNNLAKTSNGYYLRKKQA